MLHIGMTLDRRYRIEHVIKQGGMGTVYRAQDLRLDRPCAVKAVPTTSAREATQIQREAGVLGRLCHPHLPAIYDCLEEDGVIFVVMQMIPGDDLEGITMRCGMPEWQSVVAWAIQLAEAVQYLHDQAPPVIHRDIKPANIRLAARGQIYLVDFGIAKLLDGSATVTAARAASVPYSPIEQLQDGSHTDQQSDIYAFGATLYRLLTTTLPPSCIDRLVGKEMAPVSNLHLAVPEELESLVYHCMELWTTDRPSSMAEIIDRLQRVRVFKPAGMSAMATVPLARSPSAPVPDPGTTASEAYRVGKQALEHGDAAAARTHFTMAIDLGRTFAEAYAARATVHSRMGLVDAALEDWNAAISQGPKYPAWYMYRAALHRERGDQVAAIADLSTAIELTPDYADAYIERAAARREVGDTRGRLQDLDRVLHMAPDHRAARIARARARLENALWQSALADCNAVVDADPSQPTGYLLRASVHTELGEVAHAVQDLTQAITVDPACVEALTQRARLRQRMGDRHAALQDYDRALLIDEGSADARYRRAQLHRALGAGRRALADYRTLCRQLRLQAARQSGDEPALLTSEPSRRPIFTEVQYLMQTQSLEKARRFVQAQMGSFREDSDEDLEERAALFERVGQIDAALDDLERVARLLFSRQLSAVSYQPSAISDVNG